MKAITISKKVFQNLQPYELQKGIINTEGCLFRLPRKAAWRNEEQLLKKLYINTGEPFSNKLFTINSLIDETPTIYQEALVLPEKLAIVDYEVVGFTMPLIAHTTNLSILLNDLSIPFEQKKGYFQQISDILKAMQALPNQDFFLGDIHECNFLITEDQTIKVVDLDSCKIGRNLPFPIKYLSPSKGLGNFKDKYPLHENGLHIPTKDTEWYCYNMMVLNTIAHAPIVKLSQSDYYAYLQFLSDKGYPKEFLDCVSTLYTPQRNTSCAPFLEALPQSTANVNYHVFEYHLRKQRT